ncbi:phenylalanine--tRNA ligase subunit beta [Candidatus Nanohalococcus occultus]|uniref:phenylalanine--tRNA ligase subunit beta n=1 Tax=Candidatus Nanohalococcus occultus TaxID=2978047 RepID=UPI0039DF7D20
MSHIEIDKREFEQLIGRSVSENELKEKASNLGAHWNHLEGPKWDVEVYPNRPDLLSVEGLARAYRGFFEVYTGEENYESKEHEISLEVDSSVEDVRPYIGGAVIRDLELTEKKINGLIQLQEKLHETMGRRRDKIAIGLHDLSELQAPFTYKTVEPESVDFTPLEHDKPLHLEDILEVHEKGKEYSWILEDAEKYPIIVDANEKVLSFPPIINNQLTEVQPSTTDVFVDVTGKDRKAVKKVLNILVTALDERGGEIESVEVDGEIMPDLGSESRELDVEYFKKISGLDLTGEEIVHRLEMMKYGAELSEGVIEVEVPCYRNDVMHPYDLIEDVVIAHGYREIEPEMPEIDQIGGQEAIEKLTDTVREIVQGTGALEAHSFALSSDEKLFENMNIEKEKVARMNNALTKDYSVVRNWMLPSMMQVLESNRHRSYPQKIFEASDTAVLDDSDTGVSNRRKLAYVHAGEADYTDVKAVLQVLERELGLELEVKSAEKGCFRQGRAGDILVNGEKIGIIGELHDQVVENWGLENEVAGFELDLERMMENI